MTETSAPVLDAYRFLNARREVSLVAWCVPCGRWHWHGAGDAPGAGDGHRVAHCHADASPYQCCGYTLREVGMITKLEMQLREQQHKRQARYAPLPYPLPHYLGWLVDAPRSRTRLRKVMAALLQAIAALQPVEVYAQTRGGDFWYKALLFAEGGVLKVDTGGEQAWTRQRARALITHSRLSPVSLDALMTNWKQYGIWPQRRALCLMLATQWSQA